MGSGPLRYDATSNGERDKDQSEGSDEKDDADDVECPEEIHGQLFGAKLLVWRTILVEGSVAFGTTSSEEKCNDERECTNRIDDAPHTDSPLPG